MNVSRLAADSAPAGPERGGLRPGRAVIAFADRWWWALLLAILIGGAVLRLDGWGSYWINPDEGIYYDVATQTPEGAAAAIAQAGHPPLYYYLVRWIVAAGGGIPLVRALSLLAGVAAIALVFLVGRRLGSNLAGLVAAWLMASSPGGVMLSQVMRPYTIQLALLALGVLALLAYLDTRRRRHLAAYAIVMTVAGLLHYGTLVVMGSAALFLAGALRRGRAERRDVVALVVAHLFLLLVVSVLFVTHIAPHLKGSAYTRHAQATWLEPFFPGDPLAALATTVGVSWYAFGYGLSVPVSVLVIGAAWLQPRGRRREVAWLTLVVLVIALILAVMKLYPIGRSRHSFYLAALLAPAAGLAVDGLLRLRRRPGVACGVASMVLVVAVPAGFYLGGSAFPGEGLLQELTIPRTEAEATRRCILDETSAEDRIVSDLQTVLVVAPLFHERITPRWIEAVRDVAAVTFAGRTLLVSWQWRLLGAPAPRGLLHGLMYVIDGLETQPDERWKLSGRRVWLLQGGWGDSLLRRLPEMSRDGRRLRGPIRGGENLGVCRFYPDTYRITRERKPE